MTVSRNESRPRRRSCRHRTRAPCRRSFGNRPYRTPISQPRALPPPSGRGEVQSSIWTALGTGAVGSVPKRPPMAGQRPVTHDSGQKRKPSPPGVMPSPNAGAVSAVVWEPTLPHRDQPAACVAAPRSINRVRYRRPRSTRRVRAPCVSGRVWLRLPWPLGRAWRGRPAGLSGWRPASPGGPNGRGWPRWRGAGRASAGWSG